MMATPSSSTTEARTATSGMQIKQLGLLFAALFPLLMKVVARPTPDHHAVGLFYLLAPGRFLHPLSHEPEPLHFIFLALTYIPQSLRWWRVIAWSDAI